MNQYLEIKTNPEKHELFQASASSGSNRITLTRRDLDISGNDSSPIFINKSDSSSQIIPGLIREDFQYYYVETLSNGSSSLKRSFWNGQPDFEKQITVEHQSLELLSTTPVIREVVQLSDTVHLESNQEYLLPSSEVNIHSSNGNKYVWNNL